MLWCKLPAGTREVLLDLTSALELKYVHIASVAWQHSYFKQDIVQC